MPIETQLAPDEARRRRLEWAALPARLEVVGKSLWLRTDIRKWQTGIPQAVQFRPFTRRVGGESRRMYRAYAVWSSTKVKPASYGDITIVSGRSWHDSAGVCGTETLVRWLRGECFCCGHRSRPDLFALSGVTDLGAFAEADRATQSRREEAVSS